MKKENKIEKQLKTYFSQGKEEPRMFDLNNKLYLGTREAKSGFYADNHVGK